MIKIETEVKTDNYELYLGDCLEVMKQIPQNSIDMIITDIPYNISKKNNFKTMKDRTGRNGIDFGNWDYNFDESCLSKFMPLITTNGGMIIFHSFDQIGIITETLCDYMDLKDRVIWEKTNPMPRNRDRRYITNTEMFSWFVMRKAKWTFNRQHDNYDSSVIRYPSESGGSFKRYHPTQKNLKMMEEIVLRHSNANDTILDPFMGSGSTGLACFNTNRKFIGIEKEEKYFNISVDRIKQTDKDNNK